MDAALDSKIVLAHDWLTGMRGGEKCLEVICRRWPQAPLFTLLHHRGSVSRSIENRPITTSFLQHMPGVNRHYRALLPLMPAAAESWRLPACDLVLSFSHCVAKAARAPHGVPHVCYCFTPMRYAWHQRGAYFGASLTGRLKQAVAEPLLSVLRAWDRATTQRVTHFLAISQTVRQRIAQCYARPSEVVYPPVDTDFYTPVPARREDYFLVVSALAPYKRIDLAIEACRRVKRQLVVIGTGQDEKRLRKLTNHHVTLLGWQPNSVIREHFRRCRALLFPGEEDFGIVPLEAQACGAPVIALGRGGATETVLPRGSRHEPTGIWFEQPTADSLTGAIAEFDLHRGDFGPGAARRQAICFNARRFEEELVGYLTRVLQREAPPLRRAA